MAIEPKIDVRVTREEERSLELDADEVRAILKEWAKQHGFSHRCEVDIYTGYDESLQGASFKETTRTIT